MLVHLLQSAEIRDAIRPKMCDARCSTRTMQDKEARVVRDETDATTPRFGVPADVAIAAADVTRADDQARHAMDDHRSIQDI